MLAGCCLCARLLADFGAEVLKLELPGGDPTRRSAPRVETGPGRAESAWFGYLNFGKTSVQADASSLRDSLSGADVLVCSLSGEERDALGLDLDALRLADSSLVVADVSWFGRTGPDSEFASSDAVCRALVGMVQLVGLAEGSVVAPDYQAAIIGGLSGFIAVMTALNARERGGAGRRMDVTARICSRRWRSGKRPIPIRCASPRRPSANTTPRCWAACSGSARRSGSASLRRA